MSDVDSLLPNFLTHKQDFNLKPKRFKVAAVCSVLIMIMDAAKTFLFEAIKHDGSALERAGADVKADKAFILEIVRWDGLAIEHAAEELRADKEVVLMAVKQHGCMGGRSSLLRMHCGQIKKLFWQQ